MKIQHIIQESVDPEAVKKWMEGKYGIMKYELHDDGSVTINSTGFNMIVGDHRHPIPFNAIRTVNGSITISCYGDSTSNLHKFIQRGDYGSIVIKTVGAGPVLSFCKIKGKSRITVQITGRRPNRTTGRLMDVEAMLSQGIDEVRSGILDIHDFQERLIDGGYKEYAKL